MRAEESETPAPPARAHGKRTPAKARDVPSSRTAANDPRRENPVMWARRGGGSRPRERQVPGQDGQSNWPKRTPRRRSRPRAAGFVSPPSPTKAKTPRLLGETGEGGEPVGSQKTKVSGWSQSAPKWCKVPFVGSVPARWVGRPNRAVPCGSHPSPARAKTPRLLGEEGEGGAV